VRDQALSRSSNRPRGTRPESRPPGRCTSPSSSAPTCWLKATAPRPPRRDVRASSSRRRRSCGAGDGDPRVDPEVWPPGSMLIVVGQRSSTGSGDVVRRHVGGACGSPARPAAPRGLARERSLDQRVRVRIDVHQLRGPGWRPRSGSTPDASCGAPGASRTRTAPLDHLVTPQDGRVAPRRDPVRSEGPHCCTRPAGAGAGGSTRPCSERGARRAPSRSQSMRGRGTGRRRHPSPSATRCAVPADVTNPQLPSLPVRDHRHVPDPRGDEELADERLRARRTARRVRDRSRSSASTAGSGTRRAAASSRLRATRPERWGWGVEHVHVVSRRRGILTDRSDRIGSAKPPVRAPTARLQQDTTP
jgi:hypothetical protein